MREREAAGGVDERLRVRELDRRQLRGPAQVDEQARGLGRTDAVALRVVAEGPDVAVGLEAAGGGEPGRAPAEPGDAVPLHALHQRPERVDPERFGRAGDELLAHRADHRRRAGSR